MKLGMRFLKRLVLLGFLLPFTLSLFAQDTDYETLKPQAEQYYQEGSYQLSYEIYLKLDSLELPVQESRWVDFRVADTMWRAEAATKTNDSTKFDSAFEKLLVLIRDVKLSEEQDIVWVEVNESLGDFLWMRDDLRDWHRAWPYYEKALDWWAGAQDIELARQRYINIVRKIASPEWSRSMDYYYYGYYGNVMPVAILDNVLKIAKTDNDKAYTHYLIAMSAFNQGDLKIRQRVEEEFQASIKLGKTTDWYDDALYHYADWLSGAGRIIINEDGSWIQEPDYVKALELFSQLVKEYKKGQTRYFDDAQDKIKEITQTQVNIGVSHIFLPDSEVQFHLNRRNAGKIDFTLYKVNLINDVNFLNKDDNSRQWLQAVNLSFLKKVKSWLKKTDDKGDYKPQQENVNLDFKLPIGAYVLEAQANNVKTRELILVTNVSLVVKSSEKEVLVYFCNAVSGAPLPKAEVKFWERSYDKDKYVWRLSAGRTDENGICVFSFIDKDDSRDFYVAAVSGEQQAFSIGESYNRYRQEEQWRIYAFCDRPAYRPKETVQWKFICRKYNGKIYSTPANEIIEFEINDPRGSKVKEGTLSLNSFGSAWGSLDLSESMPLGEYQVSFRDKGKEHHIGSSVLFRLEEYKLPEFKVDIEVPEEDGKKKVFCLGDEVEVNIQASYYFGGAAANADVEVLIYEKPFYHVWYPEHEFPWFYQDMRPYQENYYGDGQVVKRETLKTDALGKAGVKFETRRNAQGDFEYRIEARVTDSSRREIIGNGTVRVTRQSYYVYLTNKHNLYQPQDKVEVDMKALDANNQPVQAEEGMVKVSRDQWVEVWTDPNGREIREEELKKVRSTGTVFPPPQKDNQRVWQLKFKGYEHEEILAASVKTDEQGEAVFTFIPQKEGYYRVEWTSIGKKKIPVKAETTVWVTTNETTQLGYRHQGVEIIVDKDTLKSGQTAPVMLCVPTNDRYVLFTVEGEDIHNYQLIHLTGTVKLVELPIKEDYVPNVFLNAIMVSGQRLFMDTKQVIIPPQEHYLDVEVKSDKEYYQPQEQGLLAIETRDYQGNPVSCDVSLGVVDEAVYYIQEDYAGDLRQFFYGSKRRQFVRTNSTFYEKYYIKLIRDKQGQVVEEPMSIETQEGLQSARGEGGKDSYMIGGEAPAVEELKCEKLAEPCSSPVRQMTLMKEKGDFEMPAEHGEEQAVQVRSDFRSTIFWQPDIVTDKQGKANVKVKFADSLTSWKATARVAAQGNQFGIADTVTRTKKPLIARLQSPRFFVVGDTVIISAVINNNTSEDLNVTPYLDAKGIEITGIVKESKVVKGEYGSILVPAQGELRVDWNCIVQKQGEANLTVTAKSNKYFDAMQKVYPVYEHGIEKFAAKSGKILVNDVTVKLDIPQERKKESTELSVQITPSMAVTMLDALPYLIGYPYGCTEQTMSRFLPAVVVAKTLNDTGIKPQVVMKKIFGGIEEEYLDKTHPQGKKDLSKLDSMAEEGLSRLYDFQHSDGGWGWWKEGDSDHFMTAYVVWGLSLAESAGVDVKDDVLNKALNYLEQEIVEEELNFDMQAWMLYALSSRQGNSGVKVRAGSAQGKAFDNLWNNRDKLNAYSRALLALSAYYTFGDKEKAQTLVRNLVNGVKIDKTPDVSVIQNNQRSSHSNATATAHWGEDGIYRHWSEGGVEATAFVLQALLTIDPRNELIEPVTNWLIKNRRGSQWNNTRDTAMVVLALNKYLQQSKELQTDVDYELIVNGKTAAKKSISLQEVFNAPSRFYINSADIKDGVNEIRIKRTRGDTPLYFAVQAKFFSLEEPVASSGSEIFVHRQYYKLVGRPTLLKGYVYEKEFLGDGDVVNSGERIETVVTIEAKNNYEYLVFEDLKPAGIEAVEIRSGEPLYTKQLKESAVNRLFGKGKLNKEAEITSDYTGQSRWVYQELRDRKTALFIDKLPQGIWEIRYDMRAEVPGKFHALPLMGYAMYVPEIRANGEEVRIIVEDKGKN